MRMLNGYYIGEEDTCKYCNGENQGTCENDCSSSIKRLSRTSLGMLDNAVWRLGSQVPMDPMPLSIMYESERGLTTGKMCGATSEYNGSNLCTDTVNRTTKWMGKIGLIYVSDYGYASIDENCASDIINIDSACKNNNWLHPSGWYWTFSIVNELNFASHMWYVHHVQNVYAHTSYVSTGGVRPSLYLSSSVQIIGGDGNTTPYKLSA